MPTCSAFTIFSSSLFSSVLTGDIVSSESCHTPLNGFFVVATSASLALPLPLLVGSLRTAAVGGWPLASACSKIFADCSELASVFMPKVRSWCSFLPIRTGRVERNGRETGAASPSSDEISMRSMSFRGNSASSSSSEDSTPPPSRLTDDPPPPPPPDPDPLYPELPSPPSPSYFMRVAREPDPAPKPDAVRWLALRSALDVRLCSMRSRTVTYPPSSCQVRMVRSSHRCSHLCPEPPSLLLAWLSVPHTAASS
jgi:hypothetical protein